MYDLYFTLFSFFLKTTVVVPFIFRILVHSETLSLGHKDWERSDKQTMPARLIGTLKYLCNISKLSMYLLLKIQANKTFMARITHGLTIMGLM